MAVQKDNEKEEIQLDPYGVPIPTSKVRTPFKQEGFQTFGTGGGTVPPKPPTGVTSSPSKLGGRGVTTSAEKLLSGQFGKKITIKKQKVKQPTSQQLRQRIKLTPTQKRQVDIETQVAQITNPTATKGFNKLQPNLTLSNAEARLLSNKIYQNPTGVSFDSKAAVVGSKVLTTIVGGKYIVELAPILLPQKEQEKITTLSVPDELKIQEIMEQSQTLTPAETKPLPKPDSTPERIKKVSTFDQSKISDIAVKTKPKETNPLEDQTVEEQIEEIFPDLESDELEVIDDVDTLDQPAVKPVEVPEPEIEPVEVPEPVVDPVPQTVPETVPQPVVEPIESPFIDPVPEPVAVVEPVPEPVTVPDPAAVAEPVAVAEPAVVAEPIVVTETKPPKKTSTLVSNKKGTRKKKKSKKPIIILKKKKETSLVFLTRANKKAKIVNFKTKKGGRKFWKADNVKGTVTRSEKKIDTKDGFREDSMKVVSFTDKKTKFNKKRDPIVYLEKKGLI
mgnify:CR=1 FL=1